MTADSDSSLGGWRVRNRAAAWVAAGFFGFLLLAPLAWVLAGDEPSVTTPEELRIGLPPDRSAGRVGGRFGALIRHLERRAGIHATAYMSDNYRRLIDDFVDGRVDLARFGGAGYVIAREAAGAVPLAMREVDSRFTTLLIARADRPEHELADFAAHVMAFGDPLSTSGHLMPRHYLKQAGIDTDNFFSHVIHTGAHDATVLAVLSGKADLGAVNAVVLRQMVERGEVREEDFRVVWESPPYPDYVWAVSPRLSPELRDRLQDAFLELPGNDPAHRAILEAAGTAAYLPVVDLELEPVRQALAAQGLL